TMAPVVVEIALFPARVAGDVVSEPPAPADRGAGAHGHTGREYGGVPALPVEPEHVELAHVAGPADVISGSEAPLGIGQPVRGGGGPRPAGRPRGGACGRRGFEAARRSRRCRRPG